MIYTYFCTYKWPFICTSYWLCFRTYLS